MIRTQCVFSLYKGGSHAPEWWLSHAGLLVLRSRNIHGKLNSYLADIDEQAEEMFFRLVKQMAEKQGVTEKMKEEDQLKWVRQMNTIHNRMSEIVYNELIYR